MRTAEIKALLVFKSYGDAVLSALALTIISSLTKNSFFPSAAQFLPGLADAQNIFAQAITDAANFDRKAIAAKKAARKALIAILDETADAVNYEGKENPVAMSTCGFPLSASSASKKKFDPTPIVVITYKTSGELLVTVKGIKGFTGMVTQYAAVDSLHDLTGEPAWVTCPGGESTCTLTDLPIGKMILIRIGVWKNKSAVVYTLPEQRMVA